MRFSGSLHDECINVHWFTCLIEVQAIVETWRLDDNEVRPCLVPKGQNPMVFVRSAVSGGLEIGR
ncbi:integrase core domain-containing protein [Duganella vulcania]|uniref:Transposase n=1 Tax=Duganella vulcania TaxID=2692166 RepID=A0A845GQC8_9BURK|nr:transposase [Duganella vulcania]